MDSGGQFVHQHGETNIGMTPVRDHPKSASHSLHLRKVHGHEPARDRPGRTGQGNSMMKRRLGMLAVLLVLGSAVPASAASWRNYGTVHSDGSPSWSIISGTARSVRDIQLGFYTPEDGLTLEVSWYRECNRLDGSPNPGAYVHRSGQPITTTAGAWTWIYIRDSDALRHCDFYAFTSSPGPHRVKVRVTG